MKLIRAQVTNFRSVEDSGEFELGQRVCLVGKNESGKSAILQAIYGLNPLAPFTYDIEHDYPRAHLNDYQSRHPDLPAPVVVTTWALSEEEMARVEARLGAKTIASNIITISRSYTEDVTRWSIDLNHQRIVSNLIRPLSFNAAEYSQIGGPADVRELVKVLEELPHPTDKQQALLSTIDGFRDRDPLLAAIDVLSMPQFMYFSHYDRMSGQISVEQLEKARHTGTLPESDSVFLDFLEFAGTDLEELKAASTFESLNSKCEAASNKITDQISKYWSQNESLRINVTVGHGERGDPAPFNTGTVVRARVYNELHRVSVPFSERSAGFIWFFSFLVKFAQVKKKHGNVVILLDEPGLTLHGKAQEDLLRYFAEQLEPQHQLIFSTHSPFMVPPNDIACVRLVEDVVRIDSRGRKRSEGTKVSGDLVVTDRETLFPLQGALGLELTQALISGPNTLIVGRPSDILYVQAFSNRLKALNRTYLSPNWTLSPAGAMGNVLPLVSLYAGNTVNVALLADVAACNRDALKRLADAGILEENRIVRITDFTGGEEANIEDVLGPELYAVLLNKAFGLSARFALDDARLRAEKADTERLVKKAESYFRSLRPKSDEFDPYQPAYVLHLHPGYLESDAAQTGEALDRFEALFRAVNRLLDKAR